MTNVHESTIELFTPGEDIARQIEKCLSILLEIDMCLSKHKY